MLKIIEKVEKYCKKQLTKPKAGRIIKADNRGKPQRRKRKMKTYYARGKKMWNYPSNTTLENLKRKGYGQIVWQNGDFLCL